MQGPRTCKNKFSIRHTTSSNAQVNLTLTAASGVISRPHNEHGLNSSWIFKKFIRTGRNHKKRSRAHTRYGQAFVAPVVDPHHEETTIEALANFASSTTADRDAISKLLDTVQELTAELKVAREKIEMLQAKSHFRCINCDTNCGHNKENWDPLERYYF